MRPTVLLCAMHAHQHSSEVSSLGDRLAQCMLVVIFHATNKSYFLRLLSIDA